MPIYEYQCTQCSQRSEFLQKTSDEPKTICPHCEANALKKIISSTSFQLKGGGWYVTDFRDANKPTSTDTKAGTENPVNDKKTAENKDKADTNQSNT
ncbi:MAG: hypothetical protein A3F10_04175 [Coxiella sp. RIFCSPHIGHO2_12_FULL_42_15]|nr:MAG: hypothetical protein A3F10_04175 [Coxiella sp. RIFCSPHIGHO2_12_FULL_42_15]